MTDFVYRPRKVPSMKARRKIKKMKGELTRLEIDEATGANRKKANSTREGAGEKGCWIAPTNTGWKGYTTIGGITHATQNIKDKEAAKIAARRLRSLLLRAIYRGDLDIRRGAKSRTPGTSSSNVTL